jgi:hypothetical protein
MTSHSFMQLMPKEEKYRWLPQKQICQTTQTSALIINSTYTTRPHSIIVYYYLFQIIHEF